MLRIPFNPLKWSGQNRPGYFVDIFLPEPCLSKIFEGEMFIRILTTTLLQIFCENLLYFQVIFKSVKIADNIYLGNSECEWVNPLMVTEPKSVLIFLMISFRLKHRWENISRGNVSQNTANNSPSNVL